VSGVAERHGFDVAGALPRGVTVLEASAGTGKTFTIAALAARYVADGMPLDRLLLVTFTRMATGELRERVRERLTGAEHALTRVLAGDEPAERDVVVRALADGERSEVVRRRDNLARAIADFDAATIATTHGFCQEALGSLGIAADVERDCDFVEDPRDLVDEVVDDLYVRRFHERESPPFDRDEALAIALAAVRNPGAPILPSRDDPRPRAAMRRRLADAVRDEFELRKRRLSIITYDDLLTRLHDALAGPGGEDAAARLRERYRVVLVDEFQDTDPIQWEIIRLAFGGGDRTLVLIGDPKQAIYAFRGADVYAYLRAARAAGAQETLRVNWRSDQGLIDAYDALFAGAKLGHEGILYRRVEAAPANREPRLTGAPEPAPLRVRLVSGDDPSVGRTPKGYVRAPAARRHVAHDLAADLVRLLESGAEVEIRSKDGIEERRERICPRHVAVLVRKHDQAALVRDALEQAGVPAVINGAGSVLGTPSAREWLRLLEALERPTFPPRARAAALTPFLGWTAEEVATAQDEAWEGVHRRLHRWAEVLRVKGVASLTETVTLAEGVPGRVLATADGERRLTDLRHVAQLLHAAATDEQLGVTALTGWLRKRIDAAAQETTDEDRSRRLESDAEAVQVLTIHRSKGLEFPVVYCPYLWDSPGGPRDAAPVAFHDPGNDDVRTIDVGLEGPEYRGHRDRHVEEERGEDLRLMYVALTRAQHQAVIWWAGSWPSRESPLCRLLFARDDEGNVAATRREPPGDADARARFEALAAEAPGRIAVERSSPGTATPWRRAPAASAELRAESFDRTLDRRWRRTSYSDITAGAYEARVASEPEEPVAIDEAGAPTAPPAPVRAEDDALRAVPSLLSDMPAGVHVGTFVHRLFETTDFAAADLDADLALHADAALARPGADVGDRAAALGGLRAAIETPLGPLAGDARLRDVGRADRLDELSFELPLVGGDEPTGRLTLTALRALLAEHLPAGDPLAGYAARLDEPELRQNVRGYLTGSIDLVLRAGSRFAVVDYKTNRLAPEDEPLTAWHFRPAALAAEMQRHHYVLQALLYAVALHRYLRWRLPAYDPERHLAGVLYLFVRGMTGPGTPIVDGTRCGVFAWRPPGALVTGLSDLLDVGEPA
jgi:exodeoxyribonuclease V beta subunit